MSVVPRDPEALTKPQEPPPPIERRLGRVCVVLVLFVAVALIPLYLPKKTAPSVPWAAPPTSGAMVQLYTTPETYTGDMLNYLAEAAPCNATFGKTTCTYGVNAFPVLCGMIIFFDTPTSLFSMAFPDGVINDYPVVSGGVLVSHTVFDYMAGIMNPAWTGNMVFWSGCVTANQASYYTCDGGIKPWSVTTGKGATGTASRPYAGATQDCSNKLPLMCRCIMS